MKLCQRVIDYSLNHYLHTREKNNTQIFLNTFFYKFLNMHPKILDQHKFNNETGKECDASSTDSSEDDDSSRYIQSY